MAKAKKKGLKIFCIVLSVILVFIIAVAAIEFWYYPKYKKTEKQPFDISSKAETDEIPVMNFFVIPRVSHGGNRGRG